MAGNLSSRVDCRCGASSALQLATLHCVLGGSEVASSVLIWNWEVVWETASWQIEGPLQGRETDKK